MESKQIISKTITLIRSRKAAIFRALAEDSRRGFWAFADQGIVSVGNFGLSIVLARHFAREQALAEYGAFWVLMELMFFLNGLQGALVVYPLSVRGASLDRHGLGRMTSESLLWTAICAPLPFLCMMTTAWVAHIPVGVGLWAGVAMILWQSQETTRRALMAQNRFRAVCLGDFISYVGQVVLVLLLSRHDSLDLYTTFQTVAATSGLGWLLQSFQLRLRRTTLKSFVAFGIEGWNLGRWMLFGNLTNIFSGALFNWNLAYWAGLEMLGVYQALVNLIRPANPLAFAVATLITPNVARARTTHGDRRARIVAARFGLLGLILLLPYLGFLIIFPRTSLELFYGAGSSSLVYASLVPLAAIAVGMVYASITLGAFLNGSERPKESFAGQVIYSCSYVVLVMPLSALFGIEGAVWGWLIASTLLATTYVYFTTGFMRGSSARSGSVAPTLVKQA